MRHSKSVRALMLLGALVAVTPCLPAQAPEVQESSGYVEVLVPGVGWRQAVVGRQLPAASVVTAWKDGRAKIDCGGSTLLIGPLTHVRVQSADSSGYELLLTEGSISVDAASGVFTIEYRGMQIHVEKGSFSLSDGRLAVTSGTVVLREPGRQPRAVPPGSAVALLERTVGPVFGSTAP